jgi:hypothetical protein
MTFAEGGAGVVADRWATPRGRPEILRSEAPAVGDLGDEAS